LEERLNQRQVCFTLFYDAFTFEGANTKTSQGKRFFHKNFFINIQLTSARPRDFIC
jgi:hypothetical protein